MRSSTFAVAATVLVSLLAVSECGVTNFEPRFLVDSIIKAILEKMRPKFADLKIDDIYEVVQDPNMNATIIVNNTLIKNLDKFNIKNLKSSLVPLRLTNFTLTWDEITASASYNFDAKFNIPKFTGPFNVYGKGDAGVCLNGVFFTIGANLEMKNNVLQIKPKGLYNFDLTIKRANVTLTSMMGSTEFGETLGVFFSNIMPNLVDTLKKPVFDAFQDDIIRVVNEILRNQGTFSGIPFEDEASDEYMDRILFDLLDESRED